MTLRKIVNLLFLLVILNGLFAQTPSNQPYQFDRIREISLFGGGGALLGLGAYFRYKTPLFTPDELTTLNPKDINAFDRLATRNSSITAHIASNYTLYGSNALPLLFLAGEDSRKDFGSVAAIFMEVTIINHGLTFLAKSTFRRPRPYVFDPEMDLPRKQKKNAKASFVSGHTSTTAANTFFAAKVFSDYYPDSKYKPVVWGTAIAIPAVTGFLRVKAGRHYPTDTIAGYIIGAAAGYFITYLHEK